MRTRIATWGTFLVLSASLGGSPAAALSLFLDDCDAAGCQGSTLRLDVQDLGGTFSVSLTIDTTGYTGTRSGLNQVGFKAVQGWSGATLDSAPSAGWADPVEAVTSSNNLCENGTSSDKVCTYGFVDVTGGGAFTWEFTLTGGSLLPVSDWHIGGQYADAAGPARGQIISASAAAVPEPSAALAFALGGLVVAAALRR